LLEAERVTYRDSVFLKDLFVVPEDITSVYPDQHGVDLASLADLFEQALGNDSVPAFTPIEDRHGNAVARLNILAEEFVTRMDLPGVGGVPCRQACRQHGTRRWPAASGDSGVENLNAGILVRVKLKKRLKGDRLSTRRPPGEHFQLLVSGRMS